MLIDALQMGFGRVHFRKGTEPRGTLHKHACVCMCACLLACMCMSVNVLHACTHACLLSVKA